MRSRLRVLVSAYACVPGKGSEAGVGWNWVRQIARFHEVWVITRANNREPIDAALAQDPMPNVHWSYFDLPRWARFWKKGHRGVRLYYFLWQFGAYFVARKLHQRVRFDLVHHVTFVIYWMPSFLALLPVPFVWGPVGGGESTPEAFRSTFTPRGKIYEALRDVARSLGQANPFVRLTARWAVLALATTDQTARRLQALGCQRVFVYSEAGLPREEIRQLGSLGMRHGNPFRLVSIGNLLHWKGFELGLRAFAEFHYSFPASEYWLIGEGPERKRLERLARQLGVADKVVFWGALPRQDVLGKLADCDALVHPSLHDSGGWVCLEAMAAGRPVICLDLGGPAVQVTEECGFKISPLSPNQTIEALAEAMLKLALNFDLRAGRGEAAQRRVSEYFSWDKKVHFVLELYNLAKAGVR